jgi:phosphoribosyl 1,2-cyclic phosphodiesterase
MSVREMISAQMDDIYFPITIREFGARVYFRDLNEGEYQVDGISVRTMLLSHPGSCLGYRIDYDGRSFCFITDNELYLPGAQQHNQHYESALADFVRGTEALVTDATYSDEEYPGKVDWGHSSVGRVVELAHRAEVQNLYLFHHDPDQDDDAINRKGESGLARLAKLRSATKLIMPAEGDTILI